MTAHTSNRIAWEYTAADGTVYRVAALKELTDQTKLGGQAWAGVVGPKPGRIKMRRITVGNTAGATRVVPVYTTTAPILVAGATISVDILGTMTTLTSDGHPIPESWERKSPVTRQSA